MVRGMIAGQQSTNPVMEYWDTDPYQHFLLRVADLIVSVVSDGSVKLGVEAKKEEFIVDNGVPDVTIKAAWGELSDDGVGNKLFDAGSVWQLYQQGESYVFRFKSLAFGPRPYKIARFSPDFSHGEVYLQRDFFEPGQPVDPLSAPLEELLYGTLLARGRGVEIHACGLIDAQGHGHLFVGKSGAGKTTMARLWQDAPGVTILSDDRIILRKMDGRIWMYGTPWHGEGGMASPDKILLTGIYFLQKGDRNELLPRRNVEAALSLSACSFPPFYSREAVEFTLGFAEEVARETPCYDLRVVPDRRAVEFIIDQI
jgi:hypothetical protein